MLQIANTSKHKCVKRALVQHFLFKCLSPWNISPPALNCQNWTLGKFWGSQKVSNVWRASLCENAHHWLSLRIFKMSLLTFAYSLYRPNICRCLRFSTMSAAASSRFSSWRWRGWKVFGRWTKVDRGRKRIPRELQEFTDWIRCRVQTDCRRAPPRKRWGRSLSR